MRSKKHTRAEQCDDAQKFCFHGKALHARELRAYQQCALMLLAT